MGGAARLGVTEVQATDAPRSAFWWGPLQRTHLSGAGGNASAEADPTRMRGHTTCWLIVATHRPNYGAAGASGATGVWPSILSAQGMKYFQFGPSVCPPSCWRQASWPSRRPAFTAGIFSVL